MHPFEYSYNKDKAVLEVTLGLEIDVSDVQEYYRTLCKFDNLPSDLCVVLRAINTRFSFSPADIHEIAHGNRL